MVPTSKNGNGVQKTNGKPKANGNGVSKTKNSKRKKKMALDSDSQEEQPWQQDETDGEQWEVDG